MNLNDGDCGNNLPVPREFLLPWKKPIDAAFQFAECGDSFLVAVPVRERTACNVRFWWDYAVVTLTETGVEVDGNPWGWDLSDVSWYIPCKQMAPSKIDEWEDTHASE